MPRYQTPHSRYRHIFVVGRLRKPDGDDDEGPLGHQDITLTKGFPAEGAAQEEADRMNVLNGDHWSYDVHVVRLVDGL